MIKLINGRGFGSNCILSEAKDDRMEAGIDTMEAKDGKTYCKNAAILIHYYAKSAHITRL